MADDFGFQPSAPSDDLGFQPAPKLPDTSGIQKMATDNLSKPQEGEGEQPTQSGMQKLDTAAGIPVSTALKGSDVPLTPQWRGHLVDAYKNGTASNAGDFMQSALHSIVPIVAGGVQRSATFVNYEMNTLRGAKEDIFNALKPFKADNADDSAIRKVIEGIGQYVGGPAFGVMGAVASPVSSSISVHSRPLTNLLQPNATEEQKQNLDQAIGGAITNVLLAASPALHGRSAPSEFAPGAGPWDNHPGSEIMQGIVDKDNPSGVTSPQIDHTIAQGFKNHPAAQDFEDVAKVLPPSAYGKIADRPFTLMDNQGEPIESFNTREEAESASDLYDIGTSIMARHDESGLSVINKEDVVDTLHEIYKQTGIHPDQVFEDARRDPAIAADVGAGRIPAAYSDLIEKPSPEQAKSQMAELEKQLDQTQSPEERQSITDKMDKLVNAAIGEKPEESSLYGDIGAKYENMPQPLKDLKFDLLSQKKATGIASTKELAEHEYLSQDKSLHFNMPDDIAGMMAKMDALSKESPPVELSKEGASKAINPLAKIFNPTGMSESSRDMATALRQGRGPENRDIAVIQDSLQKHAKTLAKMSDVDRLKLIDYMENRSDGAKNPFPELQEVADTIRDIYKQVGQKIQERFPDVGLRKDYFTHQYQDEGAAAKFFSDWVAKQGSERSLNERVFPTLSEAIEAGLKPKTTNPIETVMNYVTNMGNLMAAHRSLELAREGGIADYFRKGEQPEGWVPLEGNLAEKEGKTLFAPEDAARVYNNDVSEKVTGPAGEILDNIQRFNNFANKLVLGMSGYHLTATTMASMASDVGRAINGGEISDIAKSVTPLSSTFRGQEYVDAYLGRGDLSPELQKALDLAVKNNTINVKQQDYWKAGPAKDYVDVFKNGSAAAELKAAGQTIKEQPIIGPVKVIANEIGRTMDTISKPLFDYYIPRIKIAANIDELHDWLQNHSDATPEMQDKAAQDIGNSIDNRFGEMMRDNLFWHQITRQTLQTGLLSYSWVTGAARMVKGVPDAGMWIANKQELSSSARYLMGMAATYAVVNGVRTYIGTGHAPDDWKDFLYPRTGGTTAQGQSERELLPSHIGQYTNYLHDGISELGNEASPGLKLIYHLLANKDFRGLPITNDNNKWYEEQRWGDYLHYTLGEETPIGLKSFLQGDKKGSKIGVIEKLLGARQAPQFITDPEGYEAMMKKVNDGEYKKKVRSDKKIASQYETDDDEK